MFSNVWILEQILSWVKDVDKLLLLSTCRELSQMRSKVRFTGMYDYDKVKEVSYIGQLDTVFLYDDTWVNPTEHQLMYITSLTCRKFLGALPYRIRHLHVVRDGDSNIPPVPNTLTFLDIDVPFDFARERIAIPPRLTVLSFMELYCESLDWLPDSLKDFSVYSGRIGRIGKLPPNLTDLMLYSDDITLESVEFPNSLRSLWIRCDSRIEGLNEGLLTLNISGFPTYIKIPQSVRELTMNHIMMSNSVLDMFKTAAY